MKIMLTGASSGFGKLMAKTLISKGHTVTGTMRAPGGRNADNANEIEALGALVVELDVTDDQSVQDGLKETTHRMGGLDVVINNAGVGVAGMAEHFTIDDFKKLFEINIFGVQRINRACLPFMRGQGSGLIIYISSLLGRITLPFYGPYNASKWALEALAENYRTELSRFGIDNCIVEPGGFPTNFGQNLLMPSDQSRNTAYGDFMNVPMEMGKAFQESLQNNPAQNPQLVADAVLNLINTPTGQRPFRTIVDKMGMGELLDEYNKQLETIQHGLYSFFNMENMLTVKS